MVSRNRTSPDEDGRADPVGAASRPLRREGLLTAAITAAFLIGGCGRPALHCGNTVTTGEDDTFVVALVERGRGPFGQRLANVEVSFHAGGTELARARTDRLGYAIATAHIPAGTSTLEARAQVDSQSLQDRGQVLPWTSGRTIVVCDIDGTISETDVETLLLDPTDTGSQPLPGAAQTLQLLAEQYNLLFLTGRPVFLREKTLDWLGEKGFPAAPVILAPEVSEGIKVEPFKQSVIAKVKQLYPHALIGIGNAETDAEAYDAEGMLAIIIDKGTTRRSRSKFIAMPSWRVIGHFFKANEEVLSQPSRLQSVLSEDGASPNVQKRWARGTK